MKKMVIGLVIAALLVLTVGTIALAQEETPVVPGERVPGTRGPADRGSRGAGMVGPADGTGVMHDEMVASLAEALGIPVDEFEARRDAGETMLEIAESLGLDIEELRAVMDQARAEIIDQAYADGTITQEQYDSYLNRGSEMGQRGGGQGGQGGQGGHGSKGAGGYNGECPLPDTDS